MEYSYSTIEELVESNIIYQLLTDKLDISSHQYHKTFKQVCTEKQMNYTFIELIEIFQFELVYK